MYAGSRFGSSPSTASRGRGWNRTDRVDETLGRDGPITLVDPGLQQIDRRLPSPGGLNRNPARASEAVCHWLDERKPERRLVGVGELDAKAEFPSAAEEDEDLVLHLNHAIVLPGKILPALRKPQGVSAQRPGQRLHSGQFSLPLWGRRSTRSLPLWGRARVGMVIGSSATWERHPRRARM